MEPKVQYEWVATYCCDQDEIYTTETFVYYLPTMVLSEAAALIEKEIGDNTLFRLERTDV